MRFKQYVLTATGCTILTITLACMNGSDMDMKAQQPVGQVVVTNSTSQPVPTVAQGTTTIAGNVGITGTPNVNVVNNPAVNAQQSGSWNVGINGTIEVGNPVTNPVQVHDVDHPGRQPFQIARILTIPDGSVGGTFPVPLPAGKLVVVEQVSAQVTFTSGTQLAQMSILSEFGGPIHQVFVGLDPHPFSVGQFRTTRAIRIYAHANSRFEVGVTRNMAAGAGAAGIDIFLSGYVVDCVSPPACPLP